MSSHPSASSLRALVLAFLMTFTVLGSIPLTAEANHDSGPLVPAPAATVGLRMEPLWLSSAPADPVPPNRLAIFAPSNADPLRDPHGAIHPIRIFNGATHAYTRIEFLFTPPASGPNIQWVSEFSSAEGFNVSEDNRATSPTSTPNHRRLTFDAITDAPIGGKILPGSPPNPDLIREFNIAFRARDITAATKLDVQVLAYPGTTSGSPPGQAAWDSSCTPIVCTSFQIIFDDEPPVIRRAVTRDMDRDGHLDHLELQFSENLDPTTFDYRKFGLTMKGKPAYTVTGGYFEPMLSGGMPADDPWTPGDDADTNLVGGTGVQRLTDRITLVLEEQPFYDTGGIANLKLTYPKGGGLEDLAGNDMGGVSGGSVVMLDGAKPVITAAWAIPGDETIHVFFSEPVRGSGADAVCPEVVLADIVHNDTPGSPTDPGRIPSGTALFESVTHRPCTDRLTITMKPDPSDPTKRYQFSEVDSHPITGDLLGPALNALTCTAAGINALDNTVCNARIRDLGCPTCEAPVQPGLTLWYDQTLPGSPGIRRMTYPMVVRADMDISHDELRLTFNGPVRGNDPVKPLAITPLDIKNFDIESAQTADPNAGEGPQGIAGMYYLPVATKDDPGADTIVLKTDHPARAEDVDNVPARVILACDRVRAAPAYADDTNPYHNPAIYPVFNGERARVPCINPDPFGDYTLMDKNDPRDLNPNVDMVDVTRPTIIRVRTHDADHNGRLDGLDLTFSEPVNDQTFREVSVDDYLGSSCFNPVLGYGKEFCPDLDPEVKIRIAGYTDSEGLDCFAPYRYDTGVKTNDHLGTINSVAVTTNVNSGARFERVRDCNRVFMEKDTDVTLPTDYLLQASIRSPLFRDTATPPNDMVVYCESTSFLCPDRLFVEDGAPPVVMKAETVDTPQFDENGELLKSFSMVKPNQLTARHGDGFIDGYRLTFSEPVVDASYDPKNWKVGGEGEADYTIPGKESGRTMDINVTGGADVTRQLANDGQFTILFDEGRKPDTDARPQLTYQRVGTAQTGLRDKVGNTMVDFGVTAVDEQDGAPPQIVGVSGVAGNAFLDITFSEPVDDGARNVLVQADFQYSNRDAAKNPSGAAGKSGTEQVCHGDGTPQYPVPAAAPGCQAKALDQARLPLDRPLTAGDITNDRFQVLPRRVYEVAPSVIVKKEVPDYFHRLNVALDVTPPGPVTDLSVVTELTNANSAVLKWTAPGDDGQSGQVTTYIVTVREVNATAKPFENASAILEPMGEDIVVDLFTYVNGDEVEGVTAVVGPGQTQTVRISGLKPTTTYDVAVFAIDEAGNSGEFVQGGTSASGLGSSLGTGNLLRTRADTSPPTGTLTVTSKTHKANSVSTLHNGTFEWNQLRDDESTVVYRYALNQNPEYQVLATDRATTNRSAELTNIADGSWYFHVAGFSGGGAGKTAHYAFRIGAQEIAASSIEKANDLVSETIVREEVDGRVVNRINWTLPPQSQFPAGATFEAVEIWRNDNGLYTLVRTLPGTYDALRNGTYTDTDAAATADSEYRVNMLFSGGQRQADPLTGYTALEDRSPQPFPMWLIVLAAIAAALIVAGIVIFAMLRKKQKAAATGGVAYAWESANADALGIDEATGLPVHNVKCPTCSTPFQAVGNLPLPITCPNCSATGTLD